MGADEIAQTARRRAAFVKRTLAARRVQERRFWIAVGCAAAVHAALFIGAAGWSSPRQLGEPDASPDGISVELVDAADLMSKETVPMPPVDTGSITPPPRPQPQPPQP